jgi:hypothetical protein
MDLPNSWSRQHRWPTRFASTAQIRNPHTRRAYARAVTDFLSWCESIGVTSLHVNLTGDYTWHTNKRVAKGGFRPLRIPRTGFAKP